jgi:2-amino-4-hydroxy-6-hydroxymethyldihydropteridine diphosphokinase
VLRLSPGYLSAPHGPPQPDYVNAVVEVDSSLDPPALLAAAHRVERDMGRRRTGERWTARVIDIDLLLVEGNLAQSRRAAEGNAPDLVLPHPRMAERRFVLQPLADLAPGLVHPKLERTVSRMLTACPDASLLDGPFALPRAVRAEPLDYGGDLALRAEGSSFPDLLAQAAHGMVEAMVSRDRLREENRRDASLELPAPASRLRAADRAEALADVLAEIVVWLDADRWLPSRVSVGIDRSFVRLSAFGQGLRGRDLPIDVVPKAVTRHDLQVRRRRGTAGNPPVWTAHVVLDL